MKLAVIAIVIVALGAAVPAAAQTPNVQIYFDANLTQASANCPGSVVVDTAYVVAQNFGMWMAAIEYSISYPTQMTWLADSPTNSGLVIGTSPAGIAIAWPTPLQAFGPAVVQTFTFLWTCTDCTGLSNTPLVVGNSPVSGAVDAVRWPDNVLVNAIGMTSLICSTVPTQDTSWGRIKALYSN